MADFVIRQWDLAPYPGDQAPPHAHHGSDEAFYPLHRGDEGPAGAVWARYNASVVP